MDTKSDGQIADELNRAIEKYLEANIEKAQFYTWIHCYVCKEDGPHAKVNADMICRGWPEHKVCFTCFLKEQERRMPIETAIDIFFCYHYCRLVGNKYHVVNNCYWCSPHGMIVGYGFSRGYPRQHGGFFDTFAQFPTTDDCDDLIRDPTNAKLLIEFIDQTTIYKEIAGMILADMATQDFTVTTSMAGVLVRLDPLQKSIFDFLYRTKSNTTGWYHRPIDIARGVGLQRKKEVNPSLYRLLDMGLVEKFASEDGSDVRWRAREHLESKTV
jgi:hypothetical protein